MKIYNNILIVRTDRIGDVVLTTPVLKALRQAYPSARLSILVTPATMDLVNGNPYVDEILLDDRQAVNRGPIGFSKLVKTIASKQFDLAIIFHTKRRYNLACFLAKVPYRLGYKNNKMGFLLNKALKDPRAKGEKHEAQYCLDVLKAIGINHDHVDLFVPLQKSSEDWVGHWIIEHGLRSNEYIVIHPGASDPAKCWSSANFAKLINSLTERYSMKIVLIGTSATMPVADEIFRQINQVSEVINMTGKTSLSQTISLLRHARLLVSNDSGPVHVAAGVGCNVISLFLRDAPGINAERWKPLGPKSYFLKPQAITLEDILDLIENIFQKDNQYEIF